MRSPLFLHRLTTSLTVAALALMGMTTVGLAQSTDDPAAACGDPSSCDPGAYHGNDYLYQNAGNEGSGYQYGSATNGAVQCVSFDQAGNCLSYQYVGMNSGALQCAAYNSAGACVSYLNVGTAGLQCVSVDGGGSCLAYGYVSNVVNGGTIVPCPGNPMARCLFDGSGSYTVIP